MSKLLIAGLGNIGDAYAHTRHNIGFDIIDRLADTLKVTLVPGKGPFLYARGGVPRVKAYSPDSHQLYE